MKTLAFLLLIASMMISMVSYGQLRDTNDDENGDWSEQYVTLLNTPEADMMIRTGDIDNLGFGWPANFDPFSGNSTPSHGYPWTADTTNASGTDRIMVITSYIGSPPHGRDGYTSYTSRPENLPRPILLNYELDGLELSTVALQIFVDDFQAPVWHANYFVTINGVDAPYLANVINPLIQTGPIGKIINVLIPEEHFYLIESDSLSIFFDDTTTGAGDGYAIDFVKLLINVKGFAYTAKIYGTIKDAENNPIENAVVSASGTEDVFTDEEGYYIFDAIPAGITNISVTKFSYDTAMILVDLKVGDSIRKDFQLTEILDAEFEADYPFGEGLPHTVHFTDLTSMNPTTWLWDFGDGGSSTEQNPTHDYTSTGLFTVTLTASNDNETNTETKIDYIDVIVEGVEEYGVISSFELNPNPVTTNTYISFDLNEPCHVVIEIYDITGKVIRVIHAQQHSSGAIKIPFVINDLKDGIYFVRLKAGNKILTRKIILMQ
jgi:PKD repeat protein